MFLNRIHLNTRCQEARRDLSDPYQMHATLCRAFSRPDTPCPESAFLWRLEPETNLEGHPRLLIQSREQPHWEGIENQAWFAGIPDPPLDLSRRLHLEALEAGRTFRFRLRANPSTSHEGRRLGLKHLEDQEAWILRKGQDAHGFALAQAQDLDWEAATPGRWDLRITQPLTLRGRTHKGNVISVFSTLFEGRLVVTDPGRFRSALQTGIGHGKALGLGLLSIAPAP